MYCNKNRAVLWQKYDKKLVKWFIKNVLLKRAAADASKQCSSFELHCFDAWKR